MARSDSDADSEAGGEAGGAADSDFHTSAAVRRRQQRRLQADPYGDDHASNVRQAEAFDHQPRTSFNSNPALNNYGMPLPADAPVTRIHDRYLLPQSTEKDYQKRVDEKLRVLFGHRTVALKSPMDTGKTHANFCYLNSVFASYPAVRILIITSRMTLASSLNSRACEGGLPFIQYNDERCSDLEFLRAQPCVVIQLDSLKKLVPDNGWAAALSFDIVLIDECESLLMHMMSASVRNNAEVWACLKNACYSCTQLIWLDADFGSRGLSMLRAFHQRRKKRSAQFATEHAHAFALAVGSVATDTETTPLPPSTAHASSSGAASALPDPDEDVRVIVNDIKTDTRTYIQLHREHDVWQVLERLRGQGKKVAVVCSEKRSATAVECFLKTLCPGTSSLYYHADCGKQMKQDTSRCNEVWSAVDVVIYTPVITYGVDFNPDEVHFDCILAWGTAASNCVREFIQMLGRVRKLKDNTVYVYVPEESFKAIDLPSMRDIIKTELDNEWLRLKATNLLSPMLRYVDFATGSPVVRYGDELYLELYIVNRVERELSHAHYTRLFWHAIEERVVAANQIVFSGQLTDFRTFADDRAKRLEMDACMDALAKQQSLLDCLTIATAVDTDPSVAAARDLRIARKQLEAEDAAFRDSRQVRHMYNLEQVSNGTVAAGEQLTAMVALVRYHGPGHVEYFQRFCQLNMSQLHLARAWITSLHDQRRMPVLQREGQDLHDAHLIRGLLAMVGFVRCGGASDAYARGCAPATATAAAATSATSATLATVTSATAAAAISTASAALASAEPSGAYDAFAPESAATTASLTAFAMPLDTSVRGDHFDVASLTSIIAAADICSSATVNTSSVRDRLKNPSWHAWLRTQERTFHKYGIRFQSAAEFKVGPVMSLLKRTLRRLVGFGLQTEKSERSRAGDPTDSSRKVRHKITYWRLESDFRDSMIELAYSLSRGMYPCDFVRFLGDWNVTQTVTTLQPPFRWQALTGIEATSCGTTSFHEHSSDAEVEISQPHAADILRTIGRSSSSSTTTSSTSCTSSAVAGPTMINELALMDRLDAQTKRFSNGMVDPNDRHIERKIGKRRREHIRYAGQH
ncbi:hypothetical protein [Dyella sp.]|uniref:hypothetical protein n=1 Tax=Dyella sp. TaxID=1869338 RepID=UPI0028490B3D|nr:hypothetical protein [Dyella sp.]MDR3444323.1 hypothetical protein [Dyella sp.]